MVRHNSVYIAYLKRAVIIKSYMFRLLHRAIFRVVPTDIEYNCIVQKLRDLVLHDVHIIVQYVGAT
jgi:hypothetical protein